MRSAFPALVLLAVLLAAPFALPGARAATPSLQLSPTSGAPMTPVQVSGGGFPAGAAVDIVWSTMVGSRVSGSGFVETEYTIASATADGAGAIATSFIVPYDLGGPAHRVAARVGDVPLANASFTLTREVWISPTSGPDGTVIEVRLVGGGWTQYDNNVAITYDNAFLGFACSFNSGGNITVYVQVRGGVGPHIIGVYPALYWGPSDGPTPWKHAALNPADLPVPYDAVELPFQITAGSGRTSTVATDLQPVTTPDSLAVPNLAPTPVDNGTPELAMGNGGRGIVGGDLPFALAGMPAGKTVALRWNTVLGSTSIQADKNLGWVFTPANFTLVAVAAGADGRAAGTLRVPYDFGGDHVLEAVVDGQVLATAVWRIVPAFTASLSADGSRLVLHATGLGWEKYTAAWDVLYDNQLSGFVTALTSRGSANVTLPVVGEPGLHTIDIHEGSNGWPYLNMHESPWPWEPVYRFSFRIADVGGSLDPLVLLWGVPPLVAASAAAGFVAGRRRRSPEAGRRAPRMGADRPKDPPAGLARSDEEDP